MTELNSVLVVEDDAGLGETLLGWMRLDGLEATLVGNGQAALDLLATQPFDLVLSDLRMPVLDGLGLLREMKVRMPEIPVVLLTGDGSVAKAVEAMRAGAADFMLKGTARPETMRVIQKELAASRRAREAPPQLAAPEKPGIDGLVGSSPALAEARLRIGKFAPGTATVLVRGEMGTGKELAARALHALSRRAKFPFIAVNCAALPDGLFESELFGTEPGAFPGAVRKPGKAELADGGTLFLDEIGELTLAAQPKLLRFLQENEFTRLGGTKILKSTARVIAATNRPLEQMVEAQTFRADLLHRINGMTVRLPPLREHVADIAPLAKYFLASLGPANGVSDASLTEAALAQLKSHDWPGNVRQLQTFIERLIVLSDASVLTDVDVRRELASDGINAPAPMGVSHQEQLDQTERRLILEALTKARGNCTQAARLANMPRRTFYNRMNALGIKPRGQSVSA